MFIHRASERGENHARARPIIGFLPSPPFASLDNRRVSDTQTMDGRGRGLSLTPSFQEVDASSMVRERREQTDMRSGRARPILERTRGRVMV